jgi:hypothetical protein
MNPSPDPVALDPIRTVPLGGASSLAQPDEKRKAGAVTAAGQLLGVRLDRKATSSSLLIVIGVRQDGLARADQGAANDMEPAASVSGPSASECSSASCGSGLDFKMLRNAHTTA